MIKISRKEGNKVFNKKMKKIRIIWQLILSIPKTIYFNFRWLPFAEAKKIPVLVYYKTKVLKMHRGSLTFQQPRFGCVKIGFPYLNYPARPVLINIMGRIHFIGSASIKCGCEINVKGELQVGNNLRCNEGVKIDVKDKSSFGNDVLIGHECYFSDDDGHKVLQNGIRANEKEGYCIGNHVWISRKVMVLKGANISDNTVVAAGSIVTRKFTKENVIIGGMPACILKEGTNWDY